MNGNPIVWHYFYISSTIFQVHLGINRYRFACHTLLLDRDFDLVTVVKVKLNNKQKKQGTLE